MGLNSNMSQLINKLNELEKKAKNDISKNALNKGADKLVDIIKPNTPVDTGRLQDAISKSNVTGGVKPKVKVGLINADAEVMRYGQAQEFGTENMIGKKFIKGSFIKGKDEVIDTMKESIIKDISQ